jgi:hypothetical protein
MAILIAVRFPSMVLFALLLAGVAGSCVSIMAKMPMLEVSLSGELEAYQRRILSRVGAGVVASLIGCAMLGWGVLPISIQNQTFADVVNACTASPLTSCTGLKALILLGVPMLLVSNDLTLETSCTDFLVYASAGMITV